MDKNNAQDLARKSAPGFIMRIGLGIFLLVGGYSIYLWYFTEYSWIAFAFFAVSGGIIALMARRFKSIGIGAYAPQNERETSEDFESTDLDFMRIFFNEEYAELKTKGTVELEQHKLEEHSISLDKLAKMFEASLFGEEIFYEVKIRRARRGIKFRLRGIHLYAPELIEHLKVEGDSPSEDV